MIDLAALRAVRHCGSHFKVYSADHRVPHDPDNPALSYTHCDSCLRLIIAAVLEEAAKSPTA